MPRKFASVPVIITCKVTTIISIINQKRLISQNQPKIVDNKKSTVFSFGKDYPFCCNRCFRLSSLAMRSSSSVTICFTSSLMRL